MERIDRINELKSEMLELYRNNNIYNEFKIELKSEASIDSTIINMYSTIYVYIAPKREVLQILGNYKDDEGKHTKKMIYNYKNKEHPNVTESEFMEIYSNILEFCSLAEQIKLYRKLDEEEQEVEYLRAFSSNSKRFDMNKVIKFLSE